MSFLYLYPGEDLVTKLLALLEVVSRHRIQVLHASDAGHLLLKDTVKNKNQTLVKVWFLF